jgi:hypothetical protein
MTFFFFFFAYLFSFFLFSNFRPGVLIRSLWGKLAWTFLRKVVPNNAPTRILKLVPLLEVR